MKVEEFQIDAYDKLRLFGKCWLPHDSPKGVIILIHGLGEHIDRYNQWAKRFNNKGWAISGIDLRGHGASKGKRGSGTYEAYLHDIDSLFGFVRKKFGDIPRILYGHSMGGNLALGYEISRKPEIVRLIVTSPWLRLTNPPSNALVSIVKIFSRIVPSLTIPNGINTNTLSRDKTICDNAKTDSLVHNKINLRLFLQCQEWASTILNNKHKINVPLLLMHGSDDKITSWKGSYALAQETSESTKFKLWNNCYHELHHELCKEEVFEYISSWLSTFQTYKLKDNVG